MEFSVIIPSRNEKEDIRLSLDSVLTQTKRPLEILVIDDSTDGVTRDVIREYENQGVRLIAGQAKGCCGARNLGMQLAKGEVVVLLNGDVVLPPDFLSLVEKHYRSGADYVLVEAAVFNLESPFARLIEAQHRHEYGEGSYIEWTEGFSCRREAAAKVGGIPGDFQVRFCRDWMLGKALYSAGFKKVVDHSIVVKHRAPDNFSEFWSVRKARGRFSSLSLFFLFENSRPFLFAKLSVKTLLQLGTVLLVVPLAWKVFQVSRYSPFKQDFFPLLRPYLLQQIAWLAGAWEGWFFLVSGRVGKASEIIK